MILPVARIAACSPWSWADAWESATGVVHAGLDDVARLRGEQACAHAEQGHGRGELRVVDEWAMVAGRPSHPGADREDEFPARQRQQTGAQHGSAQQRQAHQVIGAAGVAPPLPGCEECRQDRSGPGGEQRRGGAQHGEGRVAGLSVEFVE